MQVSEAIEGVKVYNVSAGKSLLEWLDAASNSHINLRKTHEFRNRIELVQDAEFPTACARVRFTPDGRSMIAIGTYRPRIRYWELDELTLKTERFIDCDATDFCILGDSWHKIAILRTDRVVELHTRHGRHYATRIPKFGRAVAYEPETCDLFAVGDSSQAFRLNLEQGRFLTPFETAMPSINTVTINPVHSLVAFGGENGIVEAWDARDRRKCGSLAVALAKPHGVRDITAFAYAADGITFAAGTAGGSIALYDLRSAIPLLVKEQGSGERIQSLVFHGVSSTDNEHASSRAALSAFAGVGPCVISCDRQQAKVWDQRTGETRVNIEVDARINQLETFSPDSGLMLMACDDPKIQIYYVPLLGPAPRWCGFIDQMTEELEEEQRREVFDDFKFITREDLSKLKIEHLLGTSYLRPYMHGFFIDVRLYTKMLAAANPFAFDDYRKERLKARIEAKRATRITLRKRAPALVNAKLAERMRAKVEAHNAQGAALREAASAADAPDTTNLVDARFRDLFSNPDFEWDDTQQTSNKHIDESESAEDEADTAATGDAGPKMFAMRSERSMHAMATATAAALRGGSLAEQLRDVVKARNVPLAVRAADEPTEGNAPQRFVREMTYMPKPKAKRKKDF